MHENIIIGAIIGFWAGVCIACSWRLSWHQTRPQARRVVMQEIVLPEVASLEMLDGRLLLCVIARSTPPMVRMQATQPFFLLSRQQVHQFYDALSSADDQMRELYRAASLPVDQTNDTTESNLSKKIRFVKRPVSLPYPAILSLTHLSVELTQAELMVLMVKVFSHSCSIENEDADGFYAEEPSGDGLRHLIFNYKPDRLGPALCGSFSTEEARDSKGWWFFAFQGEPDEDQVCPVCRALWMDLATQREQSLQAERSLPDDPPISDLARYDV